MANHKARNKDGKELICVAIDVRTPDGREETEIFYHDRREDRTQGQAGGRVMHYKEGETMRGAIVKRLESIGEGMVKGRVPAGTRYEINPIYKNGEKEN